MNHVDAGHHLEQFPADMCRSSIAGGCHADFARVGLGVGDEIGNRFGRDGWICLQNNGHAHDGGDRRNVADEVEIELVVKRGIDGVRRTDRDKRMAICRRTRYRLHRDVGRGTWPVLDDKRLAETF